MHATPLTFWPSTTAAGLTRCVNFEVLFARSRQVFVSKCFETGGAIMFSCSNSRDSWPSHNFVSVAVCRPMICACIIYATLHTSSKAICIERKRSVEFPYRVLCSLMFANIGVIKVLTALECAVGNCSMLDLALLSAGFSRERRLTGVFELDRGRWRSLVPWTLLELHHGCQRWRRCHAVARQGAMWPSIEFSRCFC